MRGAFHMRRISLPSTDSLPRSRQCAESTTNVVVAGQGPLESSLMRVAKVSPVCLATVVTGASWARVGGLSVPALPHGAAAVAVDLCEVWAWQLWHASLSVRDHAWSPVGSGPSGRSSSMSSVSHMRPEMSGVVRLTARVMYSADCCHVPLLRLYAHPWRKAAWWTVAAATACCGPGSNARMRLMGWSLDPRACQAAPTAGHHCSMCSAPACPLLHKGQGSTEC